MEVGFSIDPRQGLSPEDELAAVRLGAELGYASAWTPAGGDAEPFERCLRWYRAAGLATGILVQPASAQPPSFYAAPARRLWAETQGHFVLGIGSGGMAHPLPGMAVYLESLRQLLPERAPLYAAALGPGMLRLAAEVADGVALNWCSTEQVAWSRARVAQAAAAAGRTPPRVVEYIRTAVDPDPELARRSLEGACRAYARGPKAYRRHFERMGLAPNPDPAAEGPIPAAAVARVGAAGAPGEVLSQVEDLAQGLDLAIVRVVVCQPGSRTSAELVLRECAPQAGSAGAGRADPAKGS